MTALRRCISDQLADWGADPTQFAPGGAPPVALVARDEWITIRDLLAITGKTRRPTVDDEFRVLVAPDGAVAECHAITTATEPELASAVCTAVTGRRLFRPARDTGGHPVRGAASFRVGLARQPS